MKRVISVLSAITMATAGVLFTTAAAAPAAPTPVTEPTCSATQNTPCIFQGFEIDGNTAVDTNTPPIPLDWQSPAPNLTHFTDPTGSNDDIFSGGSKELQQSSWVCSVGSAPSKSDITGGDLSFRTVTVGGSSHQVVDVDFTRVGTGGDAHIDYEFNKSTSVLNTSSCPASLGIPVRSVGDILLTFDSNTGGSSVTVSAFKWNGSTYTQLNTGSQGVTFEGAENISPNLSDPGVQAGQYGEAGLDLTATIGTLTCGEFGSVYMKSRSSTSISSEVKDRTKVLPFNPGACPSSSLTKGVRDDTTNATGAFAPTTNASPGDTIEYQLLYTNSGAAPASNVTVTDPVPASMTVNGGSCTPACTAGSGTVTWSLGSVPAMTTVPLGFTAVLSSSFPAGTTPLPNTATVSDTEEGTKSSNMATVNVVAAPNSTLAKSARDDTTNPGGAFSATVAANPSDTIEYQLVYTNGGNAAATSVTVSDPIPVHSTLVTNSCSPACTTANNAITWSLGTVGAHSTVTLGFKTTLDATFQSTTTSIPNQASFTNSQEQPGTSNPVTVTVTAAPMSTLVKAARDDTTNPSGTFTSSVNANAKDTIEYQLIYTNSGTAGATTVVVTDPVPATTTFVSCTPVAICSSSNGTVTWNVGTVNAKTSVTLGFTVTLAPTYPMTSNTVTNTAGFTNDQEGQHSSNPVTVTVAAGPKSSTVKAARDDTTNSGGAFATNINANPGDTVEYQIIFTNNGTSPATGATVQDLLPAHTTYVSCSGGTSCADNSGTVTWSLGTVQPGTSATVGVIVTLDQVFPAGTTILSNTAVLSDDQGETSSSPPSTVTVTAAPVSALTKGARDDTTNPSGTFAPAVTAKPGDVIEYQLVYTNSGNAAASGVTVTDPIPADSAFGMCTGTITCTHTGTTVTWNLGTVNPNSPVTVGFTVQLAGSFPAGSTMVPNTASVTDNQGETKQSNQVVVTVNAAAMSSITKAVRDDTTNPNGAFTTSLASASPGDILEYQIIMSNGGNAPATNVVVTDPVPAHSSFDGCTPSAICSSTSGTVTWNVGTLNAGTSITLGLTVTLAATLPAGCATTITNTASFTDAQGESGSSTPVVSVTACATPNLGLLKSAPGVSGTVSTGQSITYNIAYFNTGNGDLAGATISDALPQGVQFSSCSGGTSCGNTAGTVTWTVGAVPGLTSATNPAGTVSVTVSVTAVSGCAICNVATISSPQQNGGASVSSNSLCINANPTPNVAAAKANGSALGAKLVLLGLPLLTASPVSSSQTGPGSNSNSAQLLNLNTLLGTAGSVAASVLRTTATSTVIAASNEADQTSTAEVASVNVLGVITADLVRGVATTQATPSSTAVNADGSTFVNLKVGGVAYNTVAPNTRVSLPVLGAGAFVVLNEQIASTSDTNGVETADLTVNMIDVQIPLLGAQVIVSQAIAHSQFPNAPSCAPGPNQSVSGHAFIASAATNPSLVGVTVGFVSIPPTGGSASQNLASAQIPTGVGNIASVGVASTQSSGSFTATTTTASSVANVANVCVLKEANGTCVVGATVANSQSNTTANASGASSNSTGTKFASLTVLGAKVNANVAPNTVINLAGLGFVVLNEQVCDNGVNIATTPSCVDSSGHHAGLTVRAIDVVITVPLNVLGLTPGVRVIVSEAHSDGDFH